MLEMPLATSLILLLSNKISDVSSVEVRTLKSSLVKNPWTRRRMNETLKPGSIGHHSPKYPTEFSGSLNDC